MVIDGETLLTGSFNFTKAAEERNIENLVIIRDVTIAEKVSAIGPFTLSIPRDTPGGSHER